MWKKYKLSDIGVIVGGATPSTTVEKYYGGDIPWLTPKDLSSFNDRYIARGERNITEDGLKSCSAQLLPKGSVLFSSRAPIGYVAIAKNPIATNQGFKSIVPNKDTNSLFLYYLLKHNKANIEAMGSGTTFKEVSGATMKNIEVLLPPLEEQERIAGILGALDDKIECNNRINRNLEEQAAVLFRRWFVNFEFPDPDPTSPTYGKPYRSAAGKMQDSPLGSIPQGWEVGTLEDIGSIIGGGTPSKANEDYFTSNGISWITPKDLSISKNKFTSKGETDITNLGYKNSSAKIMPKGSVLFSSRAPIGYISIAKNDLCTNQGFKSVIPNENIGSSYIYYFLKNNVESIESKASGSTFKEASGALMKSLEVLIPENKTLKSFNDICNAMFDQQEKLEEETQALATLRDTLLPKLMNNEIKTICQ